MIEAYQQSATEFATAIIAQDYDAAHQMLAPWLQPVVSPARLREFVETAFVTRKRAATSHQCALRCNP